MNIEEARTHLDESITVLNKVAKELTPTQRKKRVNDLIEAFYNDWDMFPDSYRLTSLANIILVEEIKDAHPDKVSRKSYPIMSERQLKGRGMRELSMDNNDDNNILDYLHQKHVKNRPEAFKKRTSEASLND